MKVDNQLLTLFNRSRSSWSSTSLGALNSVSSCDALVALTIGAVIKGFANNHAKATVL